MLRVLRELQPHGASGFQLPEQDNLLLWVKSLLLRIYTYPSPI